MTPLQDHRTSQLPTERDEPDPTKKGSQSTFIPRSTSISEVIPHNQPIQAKTKFPPAFTTQGTRISQNRKRHRQLRPYECKPASEDTRNGRVWAFTEREIPVAVRMRLCKHGCEGYFK